MSGFVAIVVLLTLAVLSSLLYPLLRNRGDAPVAWRSAGFAALLLVAGCAALYPLWSNFNWDEPEIAADSPESMVGRLARRLEKDPDDLQGWLLLGKSYGVLKQFPLSARAYQRADTLAKGKNADALMGLAEALINAERSDLAGRAGRLFEQAMELDATQTKAVFYSAMAAAERNEFALARTRLERLLQGNPPENVRKVLEEQIQALNTMGSMAAAEAPKAAAVASESAATAAVVSVPLRIVLAPAVAAKAGAGAPLFLSARIPGQRGPPLAAKKLEAKFPQEVELLSTDMMAGGGGFAAGQELEIQAHVSNGGSAISRSGDPLGIVKVKVGTKGRTTLEINQLKP